MYATPSIPTNSPRQLYFSLQTDAETNLTGSHSALRTVSEMRKQRCRKLTEYLPPRSRSSLIVSPKSVSLCDPYNYFDS